jgi:hypothetical protein
MRCFHADRTLAEILRVSALFEDRQLEAESRIAAAKAEAAAEAT